MALAVHQYKFLKLGLCLCSFLACNVVRTSRHMFKSVMENFRLLHNLRVNTIDGWGRDYKITCTRIFGDTWRRATSVNFKTHFTSEQVEHIWSSNPTVKCYMLLWFCLTCDKLKVGKINIQPISTKKLWWHIPTWALQLQGMLVGVIQCVSIRIILMVEPLIQLCIVSHAQKTINSNDFNGGGKLFADGEIVVWLHMRSLRYACSYRCIRVYVRVINCACKILLFKYVQTNSCS